MTDVFDAVVVGGGYAGLAAARKLTEEGCSTVLLEARDRVGGRTHTVEEAGAQVDLGGQWIGPGQDHIYALAADTGVATFPQWTAGEDVVLEDGRPRRVSGERATTTMTSTSTAGPSRRSSGRRPASRSTAHGRLPALARSTR
jgi:monoamine oxidase